jgi:hypothetical protein
MSKDRGDGASESYVVTTTDGIGASVVPLAPLAPDRYPNDVRVTADAITVTVMGNEPSSVQLVVGTPKR